MFTKGSETPVKLMLLLTHVVAQYAVIVTHFEEIFSREIKWQEILTYKQLVYLTGLPLLQLFYSIIHPLVFKERLPFLPLLFISVYSAVGVLFCFAALQFGKVKTS